MRRGSVVARRDIIMPAGESMGKGERRVVYYILCQMWEGDAHAEIGLYDAVG